jgi:hypothetical protein
MLFISVLMFNTVKGIQLMHNVTVYLSNCLFFTSPDMFRQIVMPSSGGIFTYFIRCALNRNYEVVKNVMKKL